MRYLQKQDGPVARDSSIADSIAIHHFQEEIFSGQTGLRSIDNRIFLLSEGSGQLQIDDQLFTLQGREIFLVAKGQVYCFDAGSLVSGYELVFGDCFWEKAPASASNCKSVLFNDATSNQRLLLDGQSFPAIHDLFLTFCNEFQEEDYINKADALAAYLKIIMIKIANLSVAGDTTFDTADRKLYRNFMELVSTQYKSNRDVAGFAQQLHITTRKLTGLCSKCSGKGAKEIINGQLLAEAKRLLQFSPKAIKEIAYELNFSTPDQFSHFFKLNTQLSPNRYREQFMRIGA